MLNRRLFLAAVAGLICASCASRGNGGELNELTPAEKAAGWKLLFDGKTTAGWRGYAQVRFPSHGWVVTNGCLENLGSGGHQGGGGGDLVTTGKFDDFDFKFEWAISPGGNSGVKYFVREGKSGKSGIGCEYQLLDDNKNADARVNDNRKAGSLYALIAPNANKRLKPVGEFNESEIIVRGKHVEHWLNGERIVEFEAGSPELEALIAQSKFKKLDWFGKKAPTVLLLQDHGDAVRFRNLKILKLPPSN